MSNKKIALPLIIVLAGGIGSYFAYDNYMYIHTDNAQIETKTLMLSSKVNGFVVEVKSDIGDYVKAGDVVAKIDDRDYVNNLEHTKADALSTDARMQDAQKSYNRLASLYEKGAVTQAQYDAASASFNDLKAKHLSSQSQIKQAELNLEHTQIRAPFDGFVARRAVEVGQYLNPGAPMYGFVDSTERWIIANLKETEIEGVKPGTIVDFTVDAIKSKEFKGKVVQLSPSSGATFTLIPPDNATGNFTKVVQRVPVKIAIDNLTPEDIQSLKAGLSVDVKLHRR